MKNRMDEQSSGTQARNDRALYFSDQPSADEVGRLLHPVETMPKDGCAKWRSVFDAPSSNPRQDSYNQLSFLTGQGDDL